MATPTRTRNVIQANRRRPAVTIIEFHTQDSVYRFSWLLGHTYGELRCHRGELEGLSWTVQGELIKNLAREGEELRDISVIEHDTHQLTTLSTTQITWAYRVR